MYIYIHTCITYTLSLLLSLLSLHVIMTPRKELQVLRPLRGAGEGGPAHPDNNHDTTTTTNNNNHTSKLLK